MCVVVLVFSPAVLDELVGLAKFVSSSCQPNVAQLKSRLDRDDADKRSCLICRVTPAALVSGQL